MSSLFDLAAELPQYDLPPEALRRECGHVDANYLHKLTAKRPRGGLREQGPELPVVQTSNQDASCVLDAMSLLDETLLTIYGARQPKDQPKPGTHTLDSQLSVSQLSSPPPTSERSPDRMLRRSASATSSGPTPLQSVFSQTMSFKATAPKQPTMTQRKVPPPPPLVTSESAKATEDPDTAARSTLRDLQEALDQLYAGSKTTSSVQRQRLQRSLTESFLHERLNKLQSTPFVQLARRKVQQKIDQLGEHAEQMSASPEQKQNTPSPLATGFPANQHAMFLKLAQLPDSHVAKLSTPQQKMVQFAKRYDKILQLSAQEIQKLPVPQTQLIEQLRKQLQGLGSAALK